jgi:4-hydroxy-3-methylbut-2-enyl diphosphate reductase IspH
VLPAFGAAVEDMDTLNEKKVQIFYTNCPCFLKVNFLLKTSPCVLPN